MININRFCAIALLAVTISACSQSTEEDRVALTGLWLPESGPQYTVNFKPDGVFDYFYGGATLRLRWDLGRKRQLLIKTPDGKEVARTCNYRIEQNKLSIDDGDGKTCITPASTPPQPMPRSFKRST